MNYTLIDDYINATNTHDFNNLLSIISSKAVYQFTDKQCIGLEEIRPYFENAWNLIKEEVYSATDIECIVDTEDIKIYIYNYHYNGYLNDKFVEGGGKATNVFQRIDNRWQLILEHLN